MWSLSWTTQSHHGICVLQNRNKAQTPLNQSIFNGLPIHPGFFAIVLTTPEEISDALVEDLQLLNIPSPQVQHIPKCTIDKLVDDSHPIGKRIVVFLALESLASSMAARAWPIHCGDNSMPMCIPKILE